MWRSDAGGRTPKSVKKTAPAPYLAQGLHFGIIS
jgi:hypothetical protein